MNFLLEFLPLLLFFGAYRLADIYTATAVLMVATGVQMAITYRRQGRLQPMQKVTLALILVFGTLTLVLHDERFIKWKPTVLYAAMGVALALGVWVWRKNLLKLMLGSQLPLPDRVWSRLNAAWAGYCFFMAAVNGYVAAFYTTDQWVAFKLWGYVFPVVFIIAQGLYIARHLEDPAA